MFCCYSQRALQKPRPLKQALGDRTTLWIRDGGEHFRAGVAIPDPGPGERYRVCRLLFHSSSKRGIMMSWVFWNRFTPKMINPFILRHLYCYIYRRHKIENLTWNMSICQRNIALPPPSWIFSSVLELPFFINLQSSALSCSPSPQVVVKTSACFPSETVRKSLCIY